MKEDIKWIQINTERKYLYELASQMAEYDAILCIPYLSFPVAHFSVVVYSMLDGSS